VLIPGYVKEGKSYLTIAIGCTGGRHRSVYVAERFGDWLKKASLSVEVNHRDTGDSANSPRQDDRR